MLGNYSDALEQVATAAKSTINGLRAGAAPDELANALEHALATSELDFLIEDLPALIEEAVAVLPPGVDPQAEVP